LKEGHSLSWESTLRNQSTPILLDSTPGSPFRCRQLVEIQPTEPGQVNLGIERQSGKFDRHVFRQVSEAVEFVFILPQGMPDLQFAVTL
jgi:hypothetical protein